MSNNNNIISKTTINRLVKDIAELIKVPLNNDGIYYKHDEDDILLGYALIIGPKSTIYENGYYFFKFEYPKNYPNAPPKVLFLTNMYNIRFHPNLYRNGKCCLSLLNTWTGEQWSACQSIKTILLNLLILFDNKPLLHEPGILESHRDFNQYNKVIKFMNLKVAIYNIITKKIELDCCVFFSDIIKSLYNKNKDEIIDTIKKEKDSPAFEYNIEIYKMNGICDYSNLYNNFKKLN